MTKEQYSSLNIFVSNRISELKTVKEIDFQNKWTTAFDKLVNQTYNDIIFHLENNIFSLTVTNDLSVRSYKEEVMPFVNEIKDEVNLLFNDFKNSES